MSKIESAFLQEDLSKDAILEAKLPLLDRIIIHFGIVTYRARNIAEAHKAGGTLPETIQWCYPHVKMRYESIFGAEYRIRPGVWAREEGYQIYINKAKHQIEFVKQIDSFLTKNKWDNLKEDEQPLPSLMGQLEHT